MEHGRVCVTGASGYVASWLIKRLLLSGYHVVGTVRDPGNEVKVAHLWNLQGAKERLGLVKAELTEEGSFDNAIMGCAGVFHVASPVPEQLGGPGEDLLKAAVNGTLNVLRSCKKNPSLRRVVLASSSTTIRFREKFDSDVPLDESSWSSVELCEKLKIWYPMSKIMSEKTAWEFCNENGIDLVTVIPSFVVGPSLNRTLSSSASYIFGLLQGKTEKLESYGRMGHVHVDDVARCHILVYEHEETKGRYLCSSPVINIDELVSILSQRYPSLPIPKRFEQGERSYYEYNTTKIKSLGFVFKSVQEMFDDFITSLVEQGHLSMP